MFRSPTAQNISAALQASMNSDSPRTSLLATKTRSGSFGGTASSRLAFWAMTAANDADATRQGGHSKSASQSSHSTAPRAQSSASDLEKGADSTSALASALEKAGMSSKVSKELGMQLQSYYETKLLSKTAMPIVHWALWFDVSKPNVVLGSCSRPEDVKLQMKCREKFPSWAFETPNRVAIPEHLIRFAFRSPPALASSEQKPTISEFALTQYDGSMLHCTSLVMYVPADPNDLVAVAAQQMRQASSSSATA